MRITLSGRLGPMWSISAQLSDSNPTSLRESLTVRQKPAGRILCREYAFTRCPQDFERGKLAEIAPPLV